MPGGFVDPLVGESVDQLEQQGMLPFGGFLLPGFSQKIPIKTLGQFKRLLVCFPQPLRNAWKFFVLHSEFRSQPLHASGLHPPQGFFKETTQQHSRAFAND